MLIVDHAKGLKDSIDKRIANFENSKNVRQKMNLFFGFGCRNPAAFRVSGDEILKEVKSFYAILHQYFEQRAI
jgi:hypothetical protein